jgi:hypothetical protein
METRWSLAFIPFVAARAMNATWNVVQRTTLPSYRRSRLDDMSRRQSSLRVRLREGNVLTSTTMIRSSSSSPTGDGLDDPGKLTERSHIGRRPRPAAAFFPLPRPSPELTYGVVRRDRGEYPL